MILKGILLIVLISIALGRTYPIYKQCNPTWANQQLGTGPDTLCSAGCLVSSVAMALKGLGQDYNPSNLNKWLKSNNGFVHEDWLIWAAVNPIGITFQGKISNNLIKPSLDQGKVVILNVANGGHYVLAHSYNGDIIYVNDPVSSTRGYYPLSQCVDGQNGLYSVNSGGYHNLLGVIRKFLNLQNQQISYIADKPRRMIQVQGNNE